MKRIFLALFVALSLTGLAQYSYTVCKGANLTLFSPWTSYPFTAPYVTYSVNPGGLISTNPLITIQPTASATFSVYSRAVVGTSQTLHINFFSVTVTPDTAPTFSLQVRNPYILGCGSYSALPVMFTNVQTTPPGSSLSYSFMTPSSGSLGTGTLSSNPSYTINSAGAYTAIVMDNSTGCRNNAIISTSVSVAYPYFSVTTGTTGSNIASVVLNCATRSVELVAQGGYSVTTEWQYYQSSSLVVVPGRSLVINSDTSGIPSHTFLATYTISATDYTNGCKADYTVNAYQNFYRPKPAFKPQPANITCKTPSLVLNNWSTSGVPQNSPFFYGFVWSTWITPNGDTIPKVSACPATVPGTYTMVAEDVGNHCTATTVGVVQDGRIFVPVLNNWSAYFLCHSIDPIIHPAISDTMGALSYTWIAPSGVATGPKNQRDLKVFSAGNYTLHVKNEYDCVTEAVFIVDQCTGANEPGAEQSITVFPNPGNGRYVIKCNSGEEIEARVFDSGMRELARVNGVGTLVLDLSAYSDGIYIVDCGPGHKKFKVIKQAVN